MAVACAAQAQLRPDAGTLQEQPRVLPTLPAPGGPRLNVPTPPPRPTGAGPQLTPAGFRFTGNTLFDDATLQRVVAARAGRPTDLAGLQDAAREVREFYQERGYLLTDAFIPEQALVREGGVVTIQVVEARVGKVAVQVEGAAAPRAQAVVQRALAPGAAASEYGLDLPVLLVRDLSAHDATATIQPGANTGEVDVVVTVRPQEREARYSVALDNHGVRAAGQLRMTLSLDVGNLTGIGDALSAAVQVAEFTDTRLYRLAYARPAGDAGTRATFSLARSEYALGGAFEALGATGHADILGLTLMHPFVRGRMLSVFGIASLEHKLLDDRVASGAGSRRRITLARLGVAGNHVREGAGSGALTSYSASVAFGHLALDDTSAALDAAPTGLQAAGGFAKANFEFQRVQFLDPRFSVAASAQGQYAFRNLTSAEKMTIGGPSGVRAYPAGEGVGDHAALGALELRYQPQAVPVTLAAFYDAGRVRGARRPVQAAGNQRTLTGAGLSIQGGTPGVFQGGLSAAWRVGRERPSSGEPDRAPRLWLTTQIWF